ncbi:MAG: 7TM diverse intracellular signaling domain-containing protein [Deferribacterales bacterium]
MIRYFIVFILMLCGASAHAFDIFDTSVKRIADSRELSVYVEEGSSLNIYDMLGRRSEFKPAERDFFPYSDKTVWTIIPLMNKTKENVTLHLLNDFAAMDEVDFYVVKGWQVIKTERFGDQRPINLKSIMKRYPNIDVTLAPQESIAVFARYHSTSPIKAKLRVFDQHKFNIFVIKDVTIWGMFIGITLALIVYNLMIFTSLRDMAFVLYIIHSITNIYNALTTSGHVHTYLSPYVSTVILDLSYKLMPSLGIIFMSMFTIVLFDLRKNIRWLYKFNLVTIAVFGALALSVAYFYYADSLITHNRATAVMVQFGLLVVIFSSIVIKQKNLQGSTLFLVGTGTFMVFILCYIAYFLGKVNFGTWIIYAVPFGKTVDAFLFAVILSMKIKLLEKERLENALLVEEMNKFNSTSHLLAGILHQFKQPLIYLGSEVLNLKVEYFKKGDEKSKESVMLSNMENHIQNMNELVGNFYSFYSKNSDIREINLADVVENTMKIMNSSIKSAGVIVERVDLDKTVTTDEKQLSQALLIIIENAVSIMLERKTANPVIEISCKESKGLCLCIADNAGGINADDMKYIFNMHYSKREEKGLGIGLALAKSIIEKRLCGKLTAENSDSGAVFKITF